VLSGATTLSSTLAGLAAGLQFNPLSAAIAAAVAAALVGYKRAPRTRIWSSAAILVVGWAAGDGIRLAGATGTAGYLIAWAVAGLAVGYALPAAAGAYIGRQVHKGTGWLSAGAVAVMVVPALSSVAGAVAGGVMRVAS